MKIDRIISMGIVGGLLDGLRVEFSSKLNCIIGARGTGKTSVLELVRYALNQLPKRELSNSARKRIESLVEGNLQGGRVELGVETRDGLRYTITRAVGEDPIVCDASGNPTALSLDEHAFFHADIFSQNEVENIADNSRFQLALIDSFSRQEIDGHDQEIREVTTRIQIQSKQMEPLVDRRAQLAEYIKIKKMLKQRADFIDQLSEIRDRRFAIRKSVAERLNSALAPNIMVSVQPHGNPATYQELIEATLKGTGVRQGMVAQKQVRTLPPARGVAAHRHFPELLRQISGGHMDR